MRRSTEPHQETPEDQDFVRGIPDDLSSACLRVQDFVRDRGMSGGRLHVVELVGEIKKALGMGEIHDVAGTRVILNALHTAEQQAGFASPDVVFELLARRKRELQNASKVEE